VHPRLRSFAFGALLLVLPFSGIRVICIESPVAEVSSAGPATQAEAERPLTDCERLCPLHPPESLEAMHGDSAPSSDEESDCALSSDAAALQMLATIGVLRPAQPVAMPDVESDAPVFTSSVYSEPSLTLLAPPPKSGVL
jgi:hypothetical protein